MLGRRTAEPKTQTTTSTPSRTSLGFTLQTKGFIGFAERVCTVTTRFGPTPRPMVTRLQQMLDLTRAAHALPTLPITASVLERNRSAAAPFVEAGVEFAVHGLFHNDHACETVRSQTSDIRRAVEVFHDCGIDPIGFRAPYLRANVGTSLAVRAAGLAYQSDDSIVFDIAAFGPHDGSGDAYLRALTMYAARDAATVTCRPTIDDDLVRIPVCLPDDEMLVDRLHLSDEQCAAVWNGVLDQTHTRGDLFTMQIHPERFGRAAGPLRGVLDRAATLPDGVWLAQLRDIAQWWRIRSRCELLAVPTHDGGVTVFIQGDRRARLRIAGTVAGVARASQAVTLPADPYPAVGLRPDAPETLRAFLREEGYLTIETSPDRRCAIELDNDVAVTDEVALRTRIETAPAPVVTLSRWPDGCRSALAVTGDIDAFTMHDFVRRVTGEHRRRDRSAS